MSGGGGGSGNDGSNDMQVSGMEAAVSKEKGIIYPQVKASKTGTHFFTVAVSKFKFVCNFL